MDKYVQTEYMGRTLTVAGLAKELGKFDVNLPVITEGCDCYGAAFELEKKEDSDGPYVLIKRNERG